MTDNYFKVRAGARTVDVFPFDSLDVVGARVAYQAALRCMRTTFSSVDSPVMSMWHRGFFSSEWAHVPIVGLATVGPN